MPPDAEWLARIEDKMLQNRIPGAGIAVFLQGQLKWAAGLGVMEAGSYEKITVDTPFHACSMSKIVTALGVLRLVQEGVLDLDEDVNRYLVSWRVPPHSFRSERKVTLRNLLAHHSGIVDPEGSFDCHRAGDSLPTRMELFTGATRYNPVPLHVSNEPDTQFSYSDGGYCLIEQVVVVPGKRAIYPYMANSGYWTTPQEMAKLALQLFASWNHAPGALLRSDLGKAMPRNE